MRCYNYRGIKRRPGPDGPGHRQLLVRPLEEAEARRQGGGGQAGGQGAGGRGRAVAWPRVGEETKAIEAVYCQDYQPEIKCEAGKGSEKDSSSRIWLLSLPGEERRDESDEEDESIDEEEDDEHFAELDEIVTPAARAAAH